MKARPVESVDRDLARARMRIRELRAERRLAVLRRERMAVERREGQAQ